MDTKIPGRSREGQSSWLDEDSANLSSMTGSRPSNLLAPIVASIAELNQALLGQVVRRAKGARGTPGAQELGALWATLSADSLAVLTDCGVLLIDLGGCLGARAADRVFDRTPQVPMGDADSNLLTSAVLLAWHICQTCDTAPVLLGWPRAATREFATRSILDLPAVTASLGAQAQLRWAHQTERWQGLLWLARQKTSMRRLLLYSRILQCVGNEWSELPRQSAP